MASLPIDDRITTARVRASLSLVLPVSDVWSVSARLPDSISIANDPAVLHGVFRSAQLRLMKQWVLSWITESGYPRGFDQLERRLYERQRDDVLILVLHLGTSLTTSEIAELLDIPRDDILRKLYEARTSLLDDRPTPCDEMSTTISAYRDGQFDLATTASITHHRATCSACDAALTAFEELDTLILRHIEARESDWETAPQRQRLGTQLKVAAIPVLAIAAIIVVAGFSTTALARMLLSTEATPLYAAAPEQAAGEQGWVIYGTLDGGIHAFDPVHGEREILLPEYFTTHIQDGANYLVSPNGEQIAIFSQNEIPGLHWATRQIRIVSISGETINEIEWHNEQEAGWPTGWLGNDELLITSIPVYQSGETTERFLARLERLGELRAVDVRTGEQRTVFTGAVAQAIPSPDASRLAIVRPREPEQPGATVELWAVEDGVATEIIGSLEHQFTWTGGLLWNPDSTSLILGSIADFENQRAETSRDETFRGQITQIDLVEMTRDGSTNLFAESAADTASVIVGFSADGSSITYTQQPIINVDESNSFWEYDTATGQRKEIILEHDELQFHPTRSGTLGYQTGFVAHPGGDGFMLHAGAPHYLREDPTHHVTNPPRGIYLLQLDREGNSHVATMVSSEWPLTPLAWIPGEQMTPATFPKLNHATAASDPEPVTEIRPYAQLGSDSERSPDGAALPMVETIDDGERPYLWFPIVETGRWIANETRDLSWHASSHSFLGVTELGGRNGGMYRITQHNASQRGGSSIDGFFDPLRIDATPDVRYAAPAASPDVTQTSFFSVDQASGNITLWLADWLDEATDVYDYSIPPGVTDLTSPVNLWLDNDSFLFVEQEEWDYGLPTRTVLHRAELTDNGEIETSTVLELVISGRDRGVDLVEVALGPDNEYLAWRARHYTDTSDPREGYDTVHIAPTSDLLDSIEVDRASKSTGLAWSPAGQALAIGSGDSVTVYAVEHHSTRTVSGSLQPAGYPAWLAEDELWFNVGESDNTEVFRVRFTEES
jgi:hypothetical protein